jgi:DNA polymerase III delta prime subunit
MMYPLVMDDSWCREFFAAAIAQGRFAHAYLLLGPDPETKAHLSRWLGQKLNCVQTDGSAPCGTCQNCSWIASDQHPEVPWHLEPSGKKGIVPVETVRKLLRSLATRSHYHRLVVVPDASRDALAKASANALLKTLEEPGKRVVFLLYAPDREAVLPTVASRCQSLLVPGTPRAGDLEAAQEFASRALGCRLSDLEASRLAEDYANQLTPELLSGLAEVCLNDPRHWHRAAHVERARTRLRGFCSARPLLEELVWELRE